MKAMRLFLGLWLVPIAISGLVMWVDAVSILDMEPGAAAMIFYLLGIPAFGVAFVLPRFLTKFKTRFGAVIATASLMSLLAMAAAAVYYRQAGHDDDPELVLFQGIFCTCLFTTEAMLSRIRFGKSEKPKPKIAITPSFALRLVFWIVLPEAVFSAILLFDEFPPQITISGLGVFFGAILAFAACINCAALFAIWVVSKTAFLARHNLVFIVASTLFAIAVGLLCASPWLTKVTVGVVMTLVFPCLFSSSAMLFLVRQKTESRVKDYKIMALGRSISRKESEYNELKRQVNPHFFFNNLNMLLSFVESDPAKALVFGTRLSGVYRKFLTAQDEDFVCLADEIEFASDYLDIYRAKFGSSFHVKCAAEPDLKFFVLAHALQEIVDNIFKHNTLDDDDPISIEIFREENNLIVRNSKRPKPSRHAAKTGLDNIARRYELLSGQSISVSETSEIFVVNLPILIFE